MSETNGIVISGMKYKESSKILTIYTRELGKVSVLAQGALRPKSGVMASTEVFALSNWKLRKGRTFHYIESVDLIDSFYTIRDSMEKMLFGFYALELLDKSTPMEEENVVLFELLEKFIRTMKGLKNILPLMVAYELKFSSFIGYRPHLDGCVTCGGKSSLAWEFDQTKGGLVCTNCRGQSRYPVSDREVQQMKHLLMSKLEDVQFLDIDDNTLWRIHNRMSDYLLYNLDVREMKSLSMIKQGLF
ncbi:DNA repair protein RecO [Gudongella sp. SC589]|uniref:DNA repair protein RecO n=1 Tax=Gudongella sp. SC589 TaxID=3385990 RepID=UPI003904919D